MFYFLPIYLCVVLNSVQSADNNETLKIENSDSSSNASFSLPGNNSRISAFPESNLTENFSDTQYKITSHLIVDEKPLNFSPTEISEQNIAFKTKSGKIEKILPPTQNFVEKPPFEPSPTLGTVLEYEFNKVPVKPAFPEPRLRFPPPDNNNSPWIAKDSIWRASEQVVDQQGKPDAVATVEEVSPESKDGFTTVAGTTTLLGTTWNHKGHFQFQTVPSVDRPYQFYHNPSFTSSGPSSGYGSTGPTSHGGTSTHVGPSSSGPGGYGLGPSSNGIGPSSFAHGTSGYESGDGFSFSKPVEVPKTGSWNHYGPKTQIDCCPEEKPMRGKTDQSHGYDGLSYYGYSPWKKIIKFLTTIIPLGILISALTPSVIQITNVNDTQTTGGETFSRYRSAASDTSKKEIADHLLSSLEYIEELNQNGCEYRVFCELLLSAKNTKNSKKNVDSLLDTFSERNFDVSSRKRELKRVFDAVRTHDCQSIPCDLIPK